MARVNGNIFYTEDGGEIWAVQDGGTNEMLRSIFLSMILVAGLQVVHHLPLAGLNQAAADLLARDRQFFLAPALRRI
jgi:hypothetical protein